MKALMLLVLTTSLQVFAQTPQDKPAAPVKLEGDISGRVVSDDGQPMAGVKVWARATSGEAHISKNVNTDAEGNFRIKHLPQAPYQITCGTRGYVPIEGYLPSEPKYYYPGATVDLRLTKGGAITGQITNQLGEPIIEISVSVNKLYELDGTRARGDGVIQTTRMTDDRGRYRIFGLEPGRYLVRTNAPYYYDRTGDPHLGERIVYYPSTGIEGAQEVIVNPGEVVSGIDIRYRAEPGLKASGTLSGTAQISGRGSWLRVEIMSLPGGARIQRIDSNGGPPFSKFQFTGLSDGEYLVEASGSLDGFQGKRLFRARKRITLKGADVTGVQLKLVAQADIEGKVFVERLASEKLHLTRTVNAQEVQLTLQSDDPMIDEEDQSWVERSRTSPDEKGSFFLFGMPVGRFRLITKFPTDDLYLKSITRELKSTGGKPQSEDLGKSGVRLGSGEKLTGVNVKVAEGAARIGGQVALKDAAGSVKVFLVPAEKEASDDVLRYYEEWAGNGGQFELVSLAPGQYYLVAQSSTQQSTDTKLLVWDPATRLRLRAEAIAANRVVTLSPGQRLLNIEIPAPAVGKKR